MSRRLRLDAELVRRGLARSREQAAELIAGGRVAVGGQRAVKPASQVGIDAAITIEQISDEPDYVSRGARKLVGALAAFGGRSGAAHVVAVDVGYGQLAWSLRTDDRVTVLDRVNVRSLEPAQVAPAPGLVVADLSFISLALVIPALVACAAPEADFVLMVKPQFEVGRQLVGDGVVRDPELRASAVAAVAASAAQSGLGVRGVTASPLPGPSGNVEYFLWLRRGAPPLDPDALTAAVAAGPQ
jgi:23S rRNA (cytidine1920-2'-O)/16S rRNA (cytidine1409-2'-O)-methyltransferase